jgi:hypothetical protein
MREDVVDGRWELTEAFAAVVADVQAALLDAGEDGLRVADAEVDVLEVSDMRRGREAPVVRAGDFLHGLHLAPDCAQVIAEEQVHRLRAREEANAALHLGRRERVHVGLGQAVVAGLPRRGVVAADVEPALLDGCEPEPALRLVQDRVDVAAFQRAVRDRPRIAVALDVGDAVNGADEHAVRGCVRRIDGLCAM